MLATLLQNGDRVSIQSFGKRRRLRNLVPLAEYQKIEISWQLSIKSEIKNPTMDEVDNGDIHDWVMIGDEKYSRIMYCLKKHIFRKLTMGEFYEDSTVD